jgi:putative ABC transport system permease protein
MISPFTDILQGMKAQKLRTFLTLTGIIWGTVAIVVLLAFGNGLTRQLARNMHGLGQRVVIAFSSSTTRPYAGFPAGRKILLTRQDAIMLMQRVPLLEIAIPEYTMDTIPVSYKSNTMKPGITGADPEYGILRNVYPDTGGRFISQLDIPARKRVAMIGTKVKSILFGNENPIGKTIMVGSIPFTVIGTMMPKTQDSNYGPNDEERIFIPSTTYESLYNPPYAENLLYRVKDPLLNKTAEIQVRQALAARHHYDPEDKDGVFLWDTSEFEIFIYYFFLIFNSFLLIVGSFTLAVGGLGVANIMYIIVKERTREIGIRRAVGARSTTIMLQFLAESMIIVLTGALVGFALAALIVYLLGFIPAKDIVGTPEISVPIALTAGGILAVVGLLAGFMPARKAARLDVVECLR